MQKNTPLNGVHFTFSSIRKALGACVLVSALAFSSQLFAQPDHYIWVGGGADNAWATLANWEVNEKTPARRPGYWVSSSPSTTTRYDRATIDGVYTVTNSGNIVFQNADPDGTKLGVFNAFELLNGANFSTTSPLRVTGAEGVTRNVLIDANSTLTSTAASNGLQIGSVANNTSIWTVQGKVDAVSALLYLSAEASTTENGGLIVNVDGGTFIVSGTTTWRSSPTTNRTDGIAQFNISNDGFLNLGVMAEFDYSTNAYVNFADSSGEFNFLYGAYSTRESVETLIDTGKIRIGGNPVTHNLFNIEDTASGWRITTAIPEPSTYALFAGICTLAAVAFVKRRRR